MAQALEMIRALYRIERALSVIPMGRKNWNVCSTELGARYVVTIQTLPATCHAHGIDPYTYVIDLMQRINTLSATQVHELTPREWVKYFGDNPLRSDLATVCQQLLRLSAYYQLGMRFGRTALCNAARLQYSQL